MEVRGELPAACLGRHEYQTDTPFLLCGRISHLADVAKLPLYLPPGTAKAGA